MGGITTQEIDSRGLPDALRINRMIDAAGALVAAAPAVQIDATKLARRKLVVIQNTHAANSLKYGFSSATQSFVLAAGATRSHLLSEAVDIWAVSAAGATYAIGQGGA